VRLQFWERLANDGLGQTPPITPGSRWMGMYTRDILQIRDSFAAPRSRARWPGWLSPLVSAPLALPPPAIDFFAPFTGLREQLVFGADFRLAFIQRAGFDRPGFGTFGDDLPYRNTEGTHANVVQADHAFGTGFYKQVFGYETAPHGEPHDSGDDAATSAVLNLEPGETFRVERLRAPGCPTGLLQLYSSYRSHADQRGHSRAGSRGLGLYTVRTADAGAFAGAVAAGGGRVRGGPMAAEFGAPAVYFDAPDGYAWLATGDAG